MAPSRHNNGIRYAHFVSRPDIASQPRPSSRAFRYTSSSLSHNPSQSQNEGQESHHLLPITSLVRYAGALIAQRPSRIRHFYAGTCSLVLLVGHYSDALIQSSSRLRLQIRHPLSCCYSCAHRALPDSVCPALHHCSVFLDATFLLLFSRPLPAWHFMLSSSARGRAVVAQGSMQGKEKGLCRWALERRSTSAIDPWRLASLLRDASPRGRPAVGAFRSRSRKPVTPFSYLLQTRIAFSFPLGPTPPKSHAYSALKRACASCQLHPNYWLLRGKRPGREADPVRVRLDR